MASTFYYPTTMPHAFVEPHLNPNSAYFPPPVTSAFTPQFYASPVHATPRMKRKRSASSSDDGSDSRATTESRSPSPSATGAPQHKKRRLGTIERGLEGLSIQREPVSTSPRHFAAGFGAAKQAEPVVEEPDDLDLTDHSYSYYGDIEDYTPPPIREVKMHNSSWYEPEKDRIVITDLDDSDDEAEVGAKGTGQELHISAAALNAIRRSRSSFRVPPPGRFSDDADGSALVLYRPSPWRGTPSAFPGEPEIKILEDDIPALRPGSIGGDSMDIDMMDIEDL